MGELTFYKVLRKGSCAFLAYGRTAKNDYRGL
jgi:hypothetical protein